jgi:ribosome-binding protein aMBF1 (putative translation factor)
MVQIASTRPHFLSAVAHNPLLDQVTEAAIINGLATGARYASAGQDCAGNKDRTTLAETNQDLAAFADNLKQAREATGLSQRELADRAGLDRTYVSNLERGIGNPSLLKMSAVAKVLGVSVASLVTAPSFEKPVPTDMLAQVDCKLVLEGVIAVLREARVFG